MDAARSAVDRNDHGVDLAGPELVACIAVEDESLCEELTACACDP